MGTSLSLQLFAGIVAVWQEYGYNVFVSLNRNYHSTEWSCDAPKSDASAIDECAADYYSKNYRTLTGECNNLNYPFEGSPGEHFNRIGVDYQQFLPEIDEIDVYEPNPYDIAKELLHTKPGKPQNVVSRLNILITSWAQFIVHDMVGHEQYDITDDPHQIISESLNETMYIARQKEADDPTQGCPYKQFKNTRTSYFDGSHLYGTDEDLHNTLMDPDEPRKFKLEYISEYDEYQLPFENDEYLVGETGNFWSGLNIYHLLFAQEHNYLIDKLDELYPNTSSTSIPHDDKYHIARLIISAFIAKTHVTEFFPVAQSSYDWISDYILENEWLSDFVDDNFISDNLDNFPYKFDAWLKLTDALSEKMDPHVPAQKSEMFDALYTVHNVFREHLYFTNYEHDADAELEDEIETIKFSDTFFMENTRNINSKYSMKDILYSFGALNHPAAIELNSYPPSFTQFETEDGDVVDLATIDIIRMRERGLPKYTAMRKVLNIEEITSYTQLTDDEQLIDTLQSLYNTIDDMDLLIGMWLENTGGIRSYHTYICETQFHGLLQSAFWQLNKDRFLKPDYFNVDTYTEYGMNYLAITSLKDVIIRHYPQLEDKIHSKFAFHPWNEEEDDTQSDIQELLYTGLADLSPFDFKVSDIWNSWDLAGGFKNIISKVQNKMRIFMNQFEDYYDYRSVLSDILDYTYFADHFVEPQQWGDGILMDNVYALSPFLGFNGDEFPINEDEAIDSGWKLLYNPCENASELYDSNFPGKMYYFNDSIKNLLILNKNGLYSGMIHAFYKNEINDRFKNDKFKNPFNEYIIYEEDTFTTIYGIEILTRNAQEICADDITNTAIGDHVFIREFDENGNNIYWNVPLHIENDAYSLYGNGFEKGGCTASMGTHYIRYSNDIINCDTIYPIVLIYHHHTFVGYVTTILNDDAYLFDQHALEQLPKTWGYGLGQPVLLRTVEQFDRLKQSCNNAALFQHVMFYKPYDIVCDFDDSVQNIKYYIANIKDEIANDNYDEAYNIALILLQRIVLSFEYPWNLYLFLTNVFDVNIGSYDIFYSNSTTDYVAKFKLLKEVFQQMDLSRSMLLNYLDNSDFSDFLHKMKSDIDLPMLKNYVYNLDFSDFFDKIKSELSDIDLMDQISGLIGDDIVSKVENILSGDYDTLYSDNFIAPSSWGTDNMHSIYSPFHVFNKYPMSEQEAIELGWTLYMNGCDNPSSNFPGKVYSINGDISNLLIYNNYNAMFSGIIHAFNADQISDIHKQRMNVYYTIVSQDSFETIYGFEIQTRNLNYTCHSQQQIEEVNNNEIGDRFIYREQNDVYSSLPLFIEEGDDELITNSYQKAGCLNSMGTHYVRYINEWDGCDSIYWLTPIYHKNVLIGYIVALGNIHIDSFGAPFIENQVNHQRWRYMKWQMALFKTKEQSDHVQCDEAILLQHVFFTNPYDIVCDFDDSIVDIAYWISKIFISIKNHAISNTYMYGQLLMAHTVGQFMVPFNIANTFFDWNNLLTFQVQHIDGIFSGTILNYMKAVLFSDSDDADADDGDTNDQGSQYVFNQSDILHLEFILCGVIFIGVFIVFYFYCFRVKLQFKEKKLSKTLHYNEEISDGNEELFNLVQVKLDVNEENDAANSNKNFEFFSRVTKEKHVGLCWENVTYHVNNDSDNTCLLDNISGYVESGQVLCLLGPSGSGKTTLIEVLCGIRSQTAGNLYLNGMSKGKYWNSDDLMGYHGNATYISQDSVLHSGLTVAESIRYSAKLKRNGNVDESVHDIIHCLGLRECENTLIGDIMNKKLSFGERKRCVFGMELINLPKILFLDEILSNLDSTASFDLFKIINKLKDLGYCIILSMHQPSHRIYKMMLANDAYNMMILNKGKCMYFGGMKNAVHYFNNIGYQCPKKINPMLFYLDIVNDNFLINDDDCKYKELQLNDLMTNIQQINTKYNNNNNNVLLYTKPSVLSQILTLTERNFLNTMREINEYWFRLLMFVFFSLFSAVNFYDIHHTSDVLHNKIGFNGYLVQFLCLLSATCIYSREKRILYMRERMNSYYTSFVYSAAHILCEIPWIVLNVLILCLVTVFTVQNRPDCTWDYFIQFFLICFAFVFATNSWAIFLSSLSSRHIIIYSLFACSNAIFAMFAGIFTIWVDTPLWLRWMYDISYCNYALRALLYIEFIDNPFEMQAYGFKTTGNRTLEMFEMKDTNVMNYIGALFALGLLFRFFSYFGLKYFVPYNNVAFKSVSKLFSKRTL